MILERENQELQSRIAQAVERLMGRRERAGGQVHVSVPVTYPSGASVVVEIEQNADRIWVSDMGAGILEAEMMGAQESYQQLARKKADEFGVGYDNRAMFVLWAPSGRLESAIVCVANASAQAAADAVRHASEAQSRRQNALVFERVKRIFGERHVSRTAEIYGRRSSWEAHNVVLFPDSHRAVFEPMAAHPNSVSAKFLMFSDLRDAELDVSLNAVVESLDSLDRKSQMVGDVANIIELRAADDLYRRYGRAA